MRTNRWFILAVLFIARAAMGFQFQSIGAASSAIKADLDLDPARIGVLIGLYMLPGVVIALPGGVLARRFGERTTCLCGLVLMIAGGLLTCVAESTAAIAAGRVISGGGAVVFNLVLTNMVVSWFAGREIVTALAVILSSWPGSIAAALIAETAIAGAYGWHVVMLAAAVLASFAFVLVALLYRSPPPNDASPPPAQLSTASTRELAASFTAGVLWGAFNAGLVVFYSFMPALLTERGWLSLEAGSITSLGLWISIVSLPIGGWLVERWGRPSSGIVVSCIVAGLVMLLLPTMVSPWGSSLLLGLAIGPAAGAIVALPSRALAPGSRPVGLGVFYTAYYVLMAVGPAVAGWGQRNWGTADAALVIGGVMFLAGAPLFALFNGICGFAPDAQQRIVPER